MITPNIQIKLEGLHFTAFMAFCQKKGLTNSRAGVIALITDLPEYQRLIELQERPRQEYDGEENLQGNPED